MKLYNYCFYRIQYYPPHKKGYGIFETCSKELFNKEIARLEKSGIDYDYEIKSFI